MSHAIRAARERNVEFITQILRIRNVSKDHAYPFAMELFQGIERVLANASKHLDDEQPHKYTDSYVDDSEDESDSVLWSPAPVDVDQGQEEHPLGEMWAFDKTNAVPTERACEGHLPQVCPLSASNCWICSETFAARHHPRNANVDWSMDYESTKFIPIRVLRLPTDLDIFRHDRMIDGGTGNRCPITDPLRCWVCSERNMEWS